MRPPALVLAVLLLAAAPHEPARAQSEPSPQLQARIEPEIQPDRGRFQRWAYGDAAGLVGEASWRTPLYALGAVAVLTPVSSFDDDINPRVQAAYRGEFADYLNLVNELGGPRATIPAVGLFAASLVTDDTRFQDAAFTSLQALVYTAAINYTLKYAIGRVRPENGMGAFRFEPFSGNTSFPSGHTATAFALMTPWVLYYPNVATYGLFAVSTGTAVARLARDRHWATDVLAGGTVGFLTAYWLTKRHQGEASRVSIVPVAGRESMTLVLQMRL